MNIILHTQNAIYEALTKINYLTENHIKIYNSIPNFATLPYIKLQSIKSIDEHITQYKLLYCDNNKNNLMCNNALSTIKTMLPKLISETNILNISLKINNIQYEIYENIESEGWNGDFILEIESVTTF